MKWHMRIHPKTFSALDDQHLTINPKFNSRLKNQLFQRRFNMANQRKQLNIKDLFKQKAFLFSAALSLIVVVGASAVAVQKGQQSNARQGEIEKKLELPKNLEGVISISAMKTIAAIDVPTGSTITEVELENEDGVVLYKVKFSDGTFRLYDAKTGARHTATDNVEVNNTVPGDFVASISLQRARDIASQQRPGKTIIKIELEKEDGVVVYSVRFSDDGRVDVNASNGNVMRVRNGSTSTSTQTSTSGSDSSGTSGSDDSSNSGSGSDDSGTSGSDDNSTDDSSGSSGSDSGSGSTDDRSGKSGGGSSDD